MSAQWMPLYVGDYLRDTRRLTTLEHGAYMLLIMEYWTNGCLPEDDKRLARIAGLTLDEWQAVRPSIEELFQPGWKHRRIDKEMARATGKSESAKASAELRWQKEREAKAMRTHIDGNANADASADAKAMLPEPEPHIVDHSLDCRVASPPPAPRKAKRAKARTQIAEDAQPTERDRKAADEAGLSAETFRHEWRRFRDHHRAKGSLMLDWTAAWRTWLTSPYRTSARAGPRQQPDEIDPILAAARRRLAQSSDYATPDAAEYPDPFHENAYDPADYDGPCTIDAQATG